MCKKILFIAPVSPPVTGQSVACDILLSYLSSSHFVFLVNLSKGGFVQGVSSVRRIFEVISIFWKVFSNAGKFDVIYFNVAESKMGNLKDIIIYLICWRRLNKIIIHLHGGAGMRELLSRKHLLLRFVNSFFLKRLGGVIVLGDRLTTIYENLVPPSLLYVLPNFANNEFFIESEDIDKKFESTTTLRILFLSNLLPGKGHFELLTALEQLPTEQQRVLHVDFAGGFESLEEEMSFRQKTQEVKDVEIQVHGVVQGEQKRQLLEKAHLFCLPTYYPYEGQPISILEAYASGCAVMTTDHSGIFDTFTPGVNGFEVKPRDSESIIQVLLHSLHNPRDLYNFAQTNNQHAKAKYRSSIHLEAAKKIIFSV